MGWVCDAVDPGVCVCVRAHMHSCVLMRLGVCVIYLCLTASLLDLPRTCISSVQGKGSRELPLSILRQKPGPLWVLHGNSPGRHQTL